jgi:hypothetical protein
VHNANLIIPSFCHLPDCCRSLADRCGALGSCKRQIYFLKVVIVHSYGNCELFAHLKKSFNAYKLIITEYPDSLFDAWKGLLVSPQLVNFPIAATLAMFYHDNASLGPYSRYFNVDERERWIKLSHLRGRQTIWECYYRWQHPMEL